MKMLNKKLSIISIFLIFLSNLFFAQEFNLGSWNVLNLKYNYSSKINFFAESQLRSIKFYNDFHYYEVKGGINANVYKNVFATLGAGSYQTYSENGNFLNPKNNKELRIWPQIVFNQFIENLKIEQRYRLECRFTSNGYRNRFRYRIGFSYPFGKLTNNFKPFAIAISNEVFFTNKEPFFERNRSSIALNFKTTKSTTLQLGYLHQFDYKINDETGRDFLQVGYFLEINPN
jgi:Protein of unknown function (DUF2490)